jgi:hypothetical protein
VVNAMARSSFSDAGEDKRSLTLSAANAAPAANERDKTAVVAIKPRRRIETDMNRSPRKKLIGTTPLNGQILAGN